MSIQSAISARDTAIANAEGGASVVFNHDADLVIDMLARTREEFTTDSVWPMLKVTPTEPRALGPAMKRAQRAGLIEPTGEFVQSVSKTNHCRPLRRWKSLVFGGQ